MKRSVTWKNVDEHFDGIMLDVSDSSIDNDRIPGWKCKHCGWIVVTRQCPPGHECPEAGEKQQERADDNSR